MTGTGAVIQWNQPWLPRGRQGRELTARGDRGGRGRREGTSQTTPQDSEDWLGAGVRCDRLERQSAGPRSLRERARRTRTRMVSLERPSDGLSPGRLGGDGDGSWLLEVIVWDWNGRDRTPLTTHRTRMAGWEPTSEAIDWKGSRRPTGLGHSGSGRGGGGWTATVGGPARKGEVAARRSAADRKRMPTRAAAARGGTNQTAARISSLKVSGELTRMARAG